MTEALNPVFTQSPNAHSAAEYTDPRVGSAALLWIAATIGLIATIGLRVKGRIANRGLALGTVTSLSTLVAGVLVFKPTPIIREVTRMSKVVKKGGMKTPTLDADFEAKLDGKFVVFDRTSCKAEHIHRIRLGVLLQLIDEAKEAKDTTSFVQHKARIAYFEGLALQPTNQDSWQTRFTALKTSYGEDWVEKIAKATGGQLRTQMWK